MPLVSPQRLQGLRRKAPQLIVAAIIIATVVVVLLEILEDFFIASPPNAGGPLSVIVNGIVSLTSNVTATVKSWGYTGIFGLMLLESSSLPIPSEIVLPFAGFLVSKGTLNLWATIGVSTVAGMVGSLIDYYIGLKAALALSEHRILGKVFFTPSQLTVAVRWFDRYGAVVVFFSRLIPLFRTIVSFPAGAVKMPLTKFILYTAAGCLVWNAALIYVGYWLGSKWNEVAGVSHDLIIVVVVGVVVAFVVFLVWHRMGANHKKAPKVATA
jgi:membrane protein DedA with SNARE-associated domain